MGDVVEFHHQGEVIMQGEMTDEEYIREIAADGHRVQENARQRGELFNRLKLSRQEAGALNITKGAKQRVTSPSTIKCLPAKDLYERAAALNPNAPTYDNARKCGAVVSLFPTEASQRGLSFSACYELVAAHVFWSTIATDDKGDKLTKEKVKDNFDALVGSASAGQAFRDEYDPNYEYRGPWTVKNAARAVAIITGKVVEPITKQVKEGQAKVLGKLENAVAGLPKRKAATITKAVASEISHEFKRLQNAFTDEVNRRVQEIALEATESLRSARMQYLEEAKRDARLAANRLKGIPALMTKKEFQLVLGCLHPDKAPADRRDRFGEAFGIIKRLEDGTRWDE